MAYYTTPATNTYTYNNHYQNTAQHANYQNNWYGNGYTAMQYAKRWYPGWQPYSYRWHNNCWWVYLKQGHQYRTAYIGPNYSWHWHKSGYWR